MSNLLYRKILLDTTGGELKKFYNFKDPGTYCVATHYAGFFVRKFYFQFCEFILFALQNTGRFQTYFKKCFV